MKITWQRASNLDNFLLHDREHPYRQTVYLAGNVKVGEKGAGGGARRGVPVNKTAGHL